MMRINAWYAVLAAAGLMWHECGYDFGVFCYRIGCGAFSAAGKRAFELVPLRATMNPVRTNAACPNPSSISYAHSTPLKD
jgi:hypothetical protein